MSGPIAAVTGGTGFLGRYCIAALCDAGWQVRALARRDPAHPMLAGRAVEWVMGDLEDGAALARLVGGAQAVVHAAGLVKARSDAELGAVNRDGTARLAAAVIRHAPEGRLVLVSSLVARMPGLSGYAASKWAAEAAAVAALGPDRCIILRPPVVYGPWDREGEAVLRLARWPLVPMPAAPEPRIAMIHARDAAAAVVACCGPSRVGAGPYEICDGTMEGHGWRSIIRAAGGAGRRGPRFVPVPDGAIRAGAAVSEAWAGLSGRIAMFGRGKARELLHRHWSADPAIQLAGAIWAPRIGLAEGMGETLRWWRADRE